MNTRKNVILIVGMVLLVAMMMLSSCAPVQSNLNINNSY
jgi:hypothetical protein